MSDALQDFITTLPDSDPRRVAYDRMVEAFAASRERADRTAAIIHNAHRSMDGHVPMMSLDKRVAELVARVSNQSDTIVKLRERLDGYRKTIRAATSRLEAAGFNSSSLEGQVADVLNAFKKATETSESADLADAHRLMDKDGVPAGSLAGRVGALITLSENQSKAIRALQEFAPLRNEMQAVSVLLHDFDGATVEERVRSLLARLDRRDNDCWRLTDKVSRLNKTLDRVRLKLAELREKRRYDKPVPGVGVHSFVAILQGPLPPKDTLKVLERTFSEVIQQLKDAKLLPDISIRVAVKKQGYESDLSVNGEIEDLRRREARAIRKVADMQDKFSTLADKCTALALERDTLAVKLAEAEKAGVDTQKAAARPSNEFHTFSPGPVVGSKILVGFSKYLVEKYDHREDGSWVVVLQEFNPAKMGSRMVVISLDTLFLRGFTDISDDPENWFPGDLIRFPNNPITYKVVKSHCDEPKAGKVSFVVHSKGLVTSRQTFHYSPARLRGIGGRFVGQTES